MIENSPDASQPHMLRQRNLGVGVWLIEQWTTSRPLVRAAGGPLRLQPGSVVPPPAGRAPSTVLAAIITELERQGERPPYAYFTPTDASRSAGCSNSADWWWGTPNP